MRKPSDYLRTAVGSVYAVQMRAHFLKRTSASRANGGFDNLGTVVVGGSEYLGYYVVAATDKHRTTAFEPFA